MGPLGLVGCCHYKDVVDPCYPERYNAMARKELTQAFNGQIQNGHVLDQMVLDSHFKSGTAVLTPGGIEKLNYFIRRRPCPDTQLYLQNALIIQSDEALQEKQLLWNPEKPEEMIKARNKLNDERKEAIKEYLAAATNGRALAFNVETLDVATPYRPGITANNSMRLQLMGPPAGALPTQGSPAPGATQYGTTAAWQ
jgi:hypothetical protein